MAPGSTATCQSHQGTFVPIVRPGPLAGAGSIGVLLPVTWQQTLGHEPIIVFFAGHENSALRGVNFNKEAEEEANWLARALLLPREVLVQLRARNCSAKASCDQFGVSRQMLDFRMRMTGVERQFSPRTGLAASR